MTDSVNSKLDLIIRLLSSLLPYFSEMNPMALDQDVQRLVDQVTANTSATQSAVQAFQGQQKLIADLQSKVNSVTPGQPIDQEDLDAIKKAAADLATANAALQAAVPANTPAETQGSTPPAPVAPNTDPSTVQAPASTAPQDQGGGQPAAVPPTQADGSSAA